MKQTKLKFSTITLLIGLFMIALSVALLSFSQIKQAEAAQHIKVLTAQLRALIPEEHNEAPDDRVIITMPAMEVDGVSFCGIIELPNYNTELPIQETWNRSAVLTTPCKYLGSIYDSSLIIGGSDKAGLFDFMQQITKGDIVYITDMVGGKYSYTVSDIKKTNDVSTDCLIDTEADLVLFARNTYSLDYTIVECKFG